MIVKLLVEARDGRKQAKPVDLGARLYLHPESHGILSLRQRGSRFIGYANEVIPAGERRLIEVLSHKLDKLRVTALRAEVS